MKASLGVEAEHQRLYLSLHLSERSDSKGNAADQNPSSELNSAYLFTPSLSKNVHRGTVKPSKLPCLPASLPLQSGFDRDLGWLHWQGTYRVTEIYLQHSSISLHTRCCWLRENDDLNCSGAHNNKKKKQKKQKAPSALNITFPQSWFTFPDMISISAVYIARIDVLVIMLRKISGNSRIFNCHWQHAQIQKRANAQEMCCTYDLRGFCTAVAILI